MQGFKFKTSEELQNDKDVKQYTKLPSKPVAERNQSAYEALQDDLKQNGDVPIIRLDSKLPTDADFGI